MANHVLLVSFKSFFFQKVQCRLFINEALHEVKKELQKLNLVSEKPQVIFSSPDITPETELIKNWVMNLEMENPQFEPIILSSNETTILLSNTILNRSRENNLTIVVHTLNMNDVIKNLCGSHEKTTSDNDLVLINLSEGQILLSCPYAKA